MDQQATQLQVQKSDNESVIDIQSLSREFRDCRALDEVDVVVKRGQVFGIVGENGAGKTTLIKHILGLYKAEKGSVSVFGMNPVTHPAEVLAKIGYLSEQPDLPGWMSIAQYMSYMSAFYPNWDHVYATNLIEVLDIDQNKKIKNLSKGQQTRVGLCAAQAHKPELLLLDEPSSGLDPLVRKDILTAVIRTVVDEGRTVVFSSHFLDEVERICDHLMMFSKGKVVLSAPMDEVLNNHHQLTLKVLDKLPENILSTQIPGFLKAVEKRGEWIVHCYSELVSIRDIIKELNIELVDQRLMTLNEIFIARCPEVRPLDGK